MATFFGEVIERPSRAFWEDEYNSVKSENSGSGKKYARKLELSATSYENISTIKLFLIVHGPVSEGFVDSCLIDTGECVAEIREVEVKHDHDGDLFKRKKAKPSTIHHLSGDTVLCICSPHLDIVQAYNFTEKVSPWLKKSEQVIVLECYHLSQYLSNVPRSELPDVFLRSLKTDDFRSPVLSEPLEQPNIVKDIPAGVLTWCQIFKIPAVLYVCYTNGYEVNSISVKPFYELFCKMQFKFLKDKPSPIRKLYSAPELSSNLYT